MEWISVRDRLPKNNKLKEVIACFNEGNQQYVSSLMWRHDGFYAWTTRYKRIDNVTHWMTLPEPPKTKDK